MDANVRAARPVRDGLLFGLVVLVVLLLWFGRAAWGGWWVVNSTSTDTYMLSTIYELWAKQVGGGHLPVWFPEFAGGGYPVHAAWMYGLFYPPLALFMVLPPEAAWTWLCVLHIAFGAAGMFAFLRDGGRSAAASASGAVVFALSNFMVSRVLAGHVNILMPMCWAPWTLLFAVRTARGEPRAFLWLALTTSLGLLSGHVQMGFYLAPVVAAWALIEAKAHGGVRASLKPLAIAAALVVGLTAIQWMPAWELFQVSGHPPEKRDVVLGSSAPVSALVAQLAPRLWETREPFAHEFGGLGGPLAVAAVLFAFRLRDGRRWFWFGVVALGLVLAMGLRNPVSEFLNDLPPFRFARASGRALCLVVLAGGVLSAWAVDDLVPATAKWARAAPAAFVASALAVGVPWVEIVRHDFYSFDWSAALPPGAAEHKVHVRSGRYPYLERWGIHTLRDVCPLDTPGYKALTAEPSPAIAWWFDVGTQLGDRAGDFERPPADRAETVAFAEGLAVRTFEGCGQALVFDVADDTTWDETALAALRMGERKLFARSVTAGLESGGATSLSVPSAVRATRIPSESPSELVLRLDGPTYGQSFGALFVPAKWFPGWEQRDRQGEWHPVRIGNLAFLAAHLDPNDRSSGQMITMSYRPGWLPFAAALLLASLAASIWFVVRPTTRRLASATS